MRPRLPAPAIVTYRSRGNESTATRLAAGIDPHDHDRVAALADAAALLVAERRRVGGVGVDARAVVGAR